MITEEMKSIFVICWQADILPSDMGRPLYDYAYLSGHDWATIDGEPVFFDQ